MLSLGGCSSAPETPAGGSSPIDQPEYFPCEIARIMGSVCQQCHTDPQRSGAPFPLLRYQDMKISILGEPLYSVMLKDLDTKNMPRDPATISDHDHDVLMQWLSDGAKPSKTNDCQ